MNAMQCITVYVCALLPIQNSQLHIQMDIIYIICIILILHRLRLYMYLILGEQVVTTSATVQSNATALCHELLIASVLLLQCLQLKVATYIPIIAAHTTSNIQEYKYIYSRTKAA